MPPKRNSYQPDTLLVNHFAIFRNVQIEPVTYPYYDPATIGLAFQPFLDTLRQAPAKSVFLLHACAHNPTGVDPTREQWKEISEVFLERGHFAFFDCAYQGFASGDLDNDAWAVRYFVEKSVPLLVCQVGGCSCFFFFFYVVVWLSDPWLTFVRVSRRMLGCMVNVLGRCIWLLRPRRELTGSRVNFQC